MNRGCLVLALALALALGACHKSVGGDKPAPSASVSASVPSAPSAASLASAASAVAAAAPAAGGAYTGTYSLAPAALSIPTSKDYAHVKQAKDDPSKLVGTGTISLTIAPDGRVSGEIDTGPAAPAAVDGTLAEGEIRAVVRRKTPSDDGLTGTLLAKVAGTGADGKLSLSESNASLLREGAVSLKRK